MGAGRSIVALAAGLIGGLAALPVPAVAGAPAVPEPLRPWVPWVAARHPDLPCPLVAGERLCAWPGRLVLDLDDLGGRFALEAVADRDLDLPLPGGPALWPRALTDDGRPALARRLGDTPAVAVGAGRHRIAGEFRWSRLPEALPVPPAIALIDLRVGGRPVDRPRREAGGLLWLAGARTEGEEDRLELGVHRLLADGVPVVLTTRLTLDVAGRPREQALADPLPAGFVPVRLESDLPARVTAGGIELQLRPGEWTVTLTARSAGPVSEVAAGERPPPWPEEEHWAFRADPDVRTARLAGAEAVDPARTPLPEEWRALPAFRVAAGDALILETLSRGAAERPDDVAFARTWRLALDGGSFTVRDALSGELRAGGRLEALPPAELGRVLLAGEPQVITLDPASGGGAGVEVRAAVLDLAADLVYPRRGALPAVGWNRDAKSLRTELLLPPGWTLIAAPGTDQAPTAWIERWNVLRLFFLLVLSLAIGKLDGWRWGLLALALLAFSWFEPHGGAMRGWLVPLLLLRALERALPAGAWARAARVVRWAVAVVFAAQVALFVYGQWRFGLFPHLEGVRAHRGYPAPAMASEPPAESGYVGQPGRFKAGYVDQATIDAAVQQQTRELQAMGAVGAETAPAPPPPPPAEQAPSKRPTGEEARSAVSQTGPGVPSWEWRSQPLSWSGPVTRDHRLRLFLLPPWAELLLSLLRIAGAAALAWLLLDPRRDRPRPGAASAAPAAAALAAALLLAGAAPAAAQAPTAELLDELGRRLTRPPPCHPECVEVPRMVVAAGTEGLRIEAEVDAAAPAAWVLPGPDSAWLPARVTVDGAEAAALRRRDDGFLLLRLERGGHRVVLSGPAPDSLTLKLPLPPRVLEWRGDGWDLEGFRPDAPPPGSLRLERRLPRAQSPGDAAPAGAAPTGEGLAPWLELTRTLAIGTPWRVETELRRLGPPGAPVAVRVPLLTGETVVTPGVEAAGGEAAVALERDETVRRWRSTLAETAELALAAPEGRPFLETWVLDCSPVWHCEAEGVPPTRRLADGRWLPRWQPWPGERLTLRLTHPEPAPGPTATIDAARLAVTPGRRLLQATLLLRLRSSAGGEHAVTLPEAAALERFTVDGRERPARIEGGRLGFTVEPGDHLIEAAWRQPHALRPLERVPAVALDTPAVDVHVDLAVPPNRWLLWAGGPRWGPVVLMWQYLLVLALAAWALGRFAPAPLSALDWFLLGAGMTQVPLAAAVVVALWLVLLAVAPRLTPRSWWAYDLRQLAFAGLTVIALALLYWAVHAGLLVQPDMQVLGAGSFGHALTWYTDRVAGALPRPWVLWLPLWVWRALMLLWALWLAWRLLRWLPWAWRRLVEGGLLRGPERRRTGGGGGGGGAAAGAPAQPATPS